MRFKIQLRYVYGWDDAGWTDESDANLEPTRFQTVDHAQAALRQFFIDVRAAVAAGDMDSQAARDDYRIVPEDD